MMVVVEELAQDVNRTFQKEDPIGPQHGENRVPDIETMN
jgi:hypothetical protein